MLIARDVVLCLTDHLVRCLDIACVHILVPAEHAVNRGRLFVPILDDFVTKRHLLCYLISIDLLFLLSWLLLLCFLLLTV